MVRLYEYQGKRILESFKIDIPRGSVVSSPNEAKEVAERLNSPVVVKAQVLVTGRFKLGGIKFASTPGEAEEVAKKLLGAELRGLKIEKVLIEEKLDIVKEYYLSVTVTERHDVKGPVLIFSTEGGVDVEEIAEKHPEKIVMLSIDYLEGFKEDDFRKLLLKLDVSQDHADKIVFVASKLYDVFKKYDAHTVEINPLVVTRDGRVVAADCRIILDDNSVSRHPELGIDVPRDIARPVTPLERIAWKMEERDLRGIFFFLQLNPNIDEIARGGYIAFHGIGGGATMLAADALIAKGLKLATYIDTSGDPTASKVYRAIKVGLSIPGIEGYCLAGAVMANQEQWYHGFAIVKAFREEARFRSGFPVVILIAGNKELETHQIIREGLKNVNMRWELYGRDYIEKLDYIAERMYMLVNEYRKEREKPGMIPLVEPSTKEEPVPEGPNIIVFETNTGKILIDLNKCVAPTCGFVCVKACRLYGRGALKISNGKPALTTSNTDEIKRRLCNECLACEVLCELRGGRAIKIKLDMFGLDEVRRMWKVPT